MSLGAAVCAAVFALSGCVGDSPEDEQPVEQPDAPPAAQAPGASGVLSKGARGPAVRQLYDFLRRYGYLPNPELAAKYPDWRAPIAAEPADPDRFDDVIEQALRLYQRTQGLPEDGTLNEATSHLMNQPRCSFPDLYTPSTAGQPSLNLDPGEPTYFSSFGGTWGTRRNLTFYFANYLPLASSTELQDIAVESAFLTWSHATNFSFSRSVGSGDIQLRAGSIDGPHNVLAQSSAPGPGCTITFDVAEAWQVNKASGTISLEAAALHELGHALGLGHSADPSAVMYAYLHGSLDLTPDDILGMESRYGSFGRSFAASNYRNLYMRHNENRGKLTTISTQLDKVDASFKVVAGLAGTCSSLEALGFPGYYLRHSNNAVYLQPNDGTQLFKNDATFCARPGLAGTQYRSWESYNFPGRYLRHRENLLWVESGSGALFNADASWIPVPSLQ